MSNAYEIRLDVLKLAKEILDRNQEIEMSNITKTDSNENITLGCVNNTVMTCYSAEDILKTADKLYNFVRKND